MIAKLTGIISEIIDDYIILETGGVGYKVEGIDLKFVKQGQKINAYIYTHLTQQDIRLYGFLDLQAYQLFKKLITVSGVGPKTASNLIITKGAETIYKAINDKSVELLCGGGIGKRTSEKIILELKGKFDHMTLDSILQNEAKSDTFKEVREVLMELGYSAQEITKCAKAIQFSPDDDTQKILKLALNYLSKR